MRGRRESAGGRLILLGAVAGLLAALLTWTRPADPALFPPPPGEAGVLVHVLDNGFHVDLAVPRDRLESGDGPLAQAVRSLPPGPWVLVGWGDARFYVDTSPIPSRLPDGARAFLRPGNPSVVMLYPWPREPRPSPARASLRLSEAGFERLRGRIEASLATRDGRPVAGPRRPHGDARFFASRETFSVVHLCNHWLAEVLHAGGVPVRPVRSITSGEIMRTVEAAAALDTAAAAD